jgi:prepilin signal peptidase PulO-like enzyme (type II secretory pathway)
MGLYVILAVYVILSLIYSFEDLRRGEVPRLSMWAGILLIGLSRFFLLSPEEGISGLAGLAAGFLVYFLVFRLLKGRLGLADVWYAAFSGCVFGPLWWAVMSLCGCVFALGYMLICRVRRVSFIPFMAAGGIALLPFFLRYGGTR